MAGTGQIPVRSGCAVLAGGAGSRMGGTNKAELRRGDGTFLRHICAELEKAGLPGYISAARYDMDVPKGWVQVTDSVRAPDGRFAGPAGGLASCLRQAEEDGLDGLFIAPCDAPLYSCELIFRLAEHIESGNPETEVDAVLWKTSDGRLQTLFGWYSVRCLPALEKNIAEGRLAVRRILEDLRAKVLDPAENGLDEKLFMNINTLGEYRAL